MINNGIETTNFRRRKFRALQTLDKEEDRFSERVRTLTILFILLAEYSSPPYGTSVEEQAKRRINSFHCSLNSYIISLTLFLP